MTSSKNLTSLIVVDLSPENASAGALPPCEMGHAYEEWYNAYRFVIDVLVVSILIMIGFVGNVLSFVVLHKDKNWSTTHLLLQCLAIADTLFLAGCILFQPLVWIYPYTGLFGEYHLVFPNIMLYLWPLGIMFQTARNWITVTVTVERFVAVKYPMKAPRMCTITVIRRSLLVVVIFSVVFNVPRFFATESYQCLDPWSNETITQRIERTDFLYATVYSVFLYYVFIAIGPLLILVVLNIQLMLTLRRSAQQRQLMGVRNGAGGHQRSDVNRMLIFVISIFITCETPAAIYQVLMTSGEPWIVYIMPLTNMLVTLNSSVNFFAYCLAGSKFRKILKNLFRKRGRPTRVV